MTSTQPRLFKLTKGGANELAIVESLKAFLANREKVIFGGQEIRREISPQGTELFRFTTAIDATITVNKPRDGRDKQPASMVRITLGEIGIPGLTPDQPWEHPSFLGQVKLSGKDRKIHAYFFDPFDAEYLRGFLHASLRASREKDIPLEDIIPEDMAFRMRQARLFDPDDPAQAKLANMSNRAPAAGIGEFESEEVIQSSAMGDALEGL